MPYKEKVINFFMVFDEFCLTLVNFLCFLFQEIENDIDEEYTISRFDNYVGWAIIGVIGVFIVVNLAYLVPVKIVEIY